MRQSKKQKQLREFIEQSKPTANTPQQAKELEDMGRGRVSNKSVDNGGKSGIINIEGLKKINDSHQVVNPMDENRYLKMKTELEKRGCPVVSAKGDDERFLIAFNAEAITDENGIMHFRKSYKCFSFL